MSSKLIRNYRAGQQVVLSNTQADDSISPEERAARELALKLAQTDALQKRLEAELAKIEATRAEMIRSSESQIASMAAQAQAKGYEEGYTQGIADGQAAGEASLAGLLSQMTSLLQSMDQERASLLLNATDQAAHLAMAIAEKVVGYVVHNHKSLIVHTVNRAMAGLAEGGTLRIHLHPQDRAFLQEFWSDQSENGGQAQGWQLVPDPEIEPGGCMIFCGSASVDARLSTQLRALAAGLILDEYEIEAEEEEEG
jgi:flagellar assembly protein FliH